MINEDKWKISTNRKMWRIDFNEYFKKLGDTPYERDQQIVKCEDKFWFMFKIVLGVIPLFT